MTFHRLSNRYIDRAIKFCKPSPLLDNSHCLQLQFLIRMIRNEIFKQGIGIAYISHATFYAVKIGICGLHYYPSDPFLFLGFFQQSLFLVENFIFYCSSLCGFS